MTQVYHHYLSWEDWQNGMYKQPSSDAGLQEELIQKAVALLSDPTGLFYAMSHIVTNWVHAAEQNLTNLAINHQAWLGQAACSWQHDVPESLTRRAWWRLSVDTRRIANQIADQVAATWKGEKSCLEPPSQMSMFSLLLDTE